MKDELIIRVPDGIELSEQVLEAIKKRFPNHVHTIKNFSTIPNNNRSYAKRVDSLKRAFNFLLEAFPRPQYHDFSVILDETLMAHADASDKECRLYSNSIGELQRELSAYTGQLIDLISAAWNTSNAYAVALLNEAEQYALLEDRRPDLATVIPMNLGQGTEYVMQLDESLPPYSERILQELNELKKQNYPKTPSCIRNLETLDNHYKHTYLCNIGDSSVDLSCDLGLFISEWERTRHPELELQKIADGSPFISEWFIKLKPYQQKMMQELAHYYSVDDIGRKLKQFQKEIHKYQEELKQITLLPQWYWILPNHQQYFLEHVLKQHEDPKEVFAFLSSRLRTLPMPANYARHSLYYINQDGTFTDSGNSSLRSSHIATRDGLDWPMAVQLQHARDNWLKVMEHRTDKNDFAVTQTLISPVLTFINPQPDPKLHELAGRTIEGLFVNHPYNYARIIDYTTADNAFSGALIGKAESLLSSRSFDKRKEVRELLDNYQAILNSPSGTATYADYYGRELFISSLEHLLVSTLDGYFYGSCVSGKDRKAIELLHTDAMCLYKKYYGTWPVYVFDEHDKVNKDRRADFAAIIAKLFITWHHQEHANHNAPGADGLKTPSVYLPGDICNAIKKASYSSVLDDDDKKATNNEVHKISKGTGSKGISSVPNISFRKLLFTKLVARQLGEEQCTTLYNQLSLLLGEKHLFSMKSGLAGFFAPSIPEGLALIDAVMKRPAPPSTGKVTNDNVARMGEIFAIALSRSGESSLNRATETQDVYDRLSAIVKQPDNLSLVDDAIAGWDLLYKKSRMNNFSTSVTMY